MRKYFYVLSVLLIIGLFSLIILLVYTNNKKNSKPKESDGVITTPGENVSFELNEKIFPQDYLEFEKIVKKYKIDNSLVYKSIYQLVKNAESLVEDTERMSSAELSQYYKTSDLVSKMGIKSEVDFINLIKELKQVYPAGNVYYRNVKIDIDELNGKGFTIIVEYTNDKNLKFSLVIDYKTKDFKIVPIIE